MSTLHSATSALNTSTLAERVICGTVYTHFKKMNSLHTCFPGASDVSSFFSHRTSCGLRTSYPLLNDHSKNLFGGVMLPWTKWCWTPSDCDLRPFLKAESCKLISKSGTSESQIDILFVGDSMTHQMYESFYMLHDGPGQPAGKHDAKVQTVCDGKARVLFIRNDYIATSSSFEACSGKTDSLSEHQRFPDKRTSICGDWTQYVARASIIVLNSGAHVIPAAKYNAVIQNTTEWLRKNADGKQIIFRTTPPGHAGCNFFDEPTTSLPSEQTLVDRLIEKQFGWDKVHAHNVLAAKHFKSLKNAFVLDVENMTTLRPDGHRGDFGDCLVCLCYAPTRCVCQDTMFCTMLITDRSSRSPVADVVQHYYLPGVVDEWVRLLFNFLAGEIGPND